MCFEFHMCKDFFTSEKSFIFCRLVVIRGWEVGKKTGITDALWMCRFKSFPYDW